MPPSVSSEKTTPKPKVSSAALRSHTVISWCGPSCAASAEKYSPPGPPPMTAMRTSGRLGGRGTGLSAQAEPLQLAGGGLGQLGDVDDASRVLVRGDPLLDELLQLFGRSRVTDHTVAQYHESRH